MTTPLLPLDVLACPLTGVHLIEASAGTGKTWTLAALYVRLLLESRLPVDRILVVTYTRAATAELRERLRRRLDDLLAVLRGHAASDPFLADMALRVGDDAAREEACQRLDAAIRAFDTASIYTIHGFCQRVLTDAAFESGQTFSAELLDDDAARMRACAADFWRSRIVPDPELGAVLSARGETPESWLAEIRPFLSRPYLQCVRPDAVDLAAVRAGFAACRQALAEPGLVDGGIAALMAARGMSQTSYKPAQIAQMVQALQSVLAEPPGWNPPDAVLKLLEKWTPAKLAKGTTRQGVTPVHPLFGRIADWHAACLATRKALDDTVTGLKLALMEWVETRLAQLRARDRSRSFDDLLVELDRALRHPETGAALARHVAGQFQVALIDEFQDTDPIQYGIFSACFVREGRPVFLVGDPKQAIYSFRGADIFAYLAAHRDAPQRWTLDTNRRSVPALVSAVNRLFDRPLPFLFGEIGFAPVRAVDPPATRLDGPASAPLTFLSMGDETLGRTRAGEMATALCCDEIVRLLSSPFMLESRGSRRPLAGGDIAVLVARHAQGEAIRAGLSARGVPSVALSQDSVFASAEATEMLALLRAWADPVDEGLLRAALVGAPYGRDAADLRALAEDEAAWEALLASHAADHERLVRDGFMAAWRDCFARERIAQRLLPLPDGERRLTNLAHLAELLQREQQERPGLSALLSWFEARVADPPAGEDAVLRLESDAALVKIVTIHTAKGLQYPVVFCPFLWDGQLVRRDTAFWRLQQDEASLLVPDGLADEDQIRQARREIFAEKLRLLYVALTRAQCLQYVLWGPVKEMETAAMSWLLHGRACSDLPDMDALELAPADVLADLARLVADSGGCMALRAPEDAEPGMLPARQDGGAGAWAARVALRRVQSPWRVSSFTALTHGQHTERPDHDPGRLRLAGESAGEATSSAPRFLFPRGSRAGTCLHAIFEQIGFGQDRDGIAAVAARCLQAAGFDASHLDGAVEMVWRTLHADLGDGVTLSECADGERLVELEFLLPMARLDVAGLRAILCDPANGLAPPLREAAARLDFRTVSGFMKGFIDLACRIRGNIYLIDYKSNYLGGRDADYEPERLAVSVAAEHYYLQYLIYCVALRRYFAVRGMPLDDCFGGVRYLYLRGCAEDGTTGVWRDQPSGRLLAALEAFFV